MEGIIFLTWIISVVIAVVIAIVIAVVILSTVVAVPEDTVYRRVVAGSEVFVQSPNYPNNYAKNLDAHWVLTADSGERILIIFRFLNTELRKDILKVS